MTAPLAAGLACRVKNGNGKKPPRERARGTEPDPHWAHS